MLYTPQRKWYLLSHRKTELDHWEQLIFMIVSNEKNKKKKKLNSPPKPKPNPKQNPAPLLPLQQSKSDNRWAKPNVALVNNKKEKKLYSSEEGENNSDVNKALFLPAFNPAYNENNNEHNDDKKDDDKKDDNNDNNDDYNEGGLENGNNNNVNHLSVNRPSHKRQQQSEIIEYYYDEGSSPAYMSKDIDISEAKCYASSNLCIWRIAEQVSYDDDNGDKDKENEENQLDDDLFSGDDHDNEEEQEKKETLQVLMGTRNIDKSDKIELVLFGGDRIIADHSPIDCAMRSFRDQTAEILDSTVGEQMKQSLSTSPTRQMFWSGQKSKSVTYFYNMDYDYELLSAYNDLKGIDCLHFKKLHWINWQDIYKYSILYSDPDPLIIEKQECFINEAICQIMIENDVASYFHSLMTKHNEKEDNNDDVNNQNDNNNNNDNERDSEPEPDDSKQDGDDVNDNYQEAINNDIDNDEFDPYGMASAPKMSIASFAVSGSNIVNNKKYNWSFFDGDAFIDFDKESAEKIEESYLMNPNDIFFISIKNTKYRINLKESTQTNTKTNTKRLLRRYSIEEDESNEFQSVFASNGNILSYNPEWQIKQDFEQKKNQIKLARKKKNAKAIWQVMNENGNWIDYDKDLSLQLQIASLSTVLHSFTNNKGNECEINFEIMEEKDLSTSITRPIRKLESETMLD